jgi:hypothetical protein
MKWDAKSNKIFSCVAKKGHGDEEHSNIFIPLYLCAEFVRCLSPFF